MRVYFISLIFLSTFLYPSEGEKLTQENCVACHDDTNLKLISLDSMSIYSEEDLINILQQGKMKTQAEHLSTEEIQAIAGHISENNIPAKEEANICNNDLSLADLFVGAHWPSFGFDASNSRNQTNTTISSSNIEKLELRWSFGIKNVQVRSQPVVIGKMVLLSGANTLYAVDKEKGCVYWSFKSKTQIRNSAAFDKLTEDAIYIIDNDFIVYKLNAVDGTIIWKTKIPKEHESNTPSASPLQVDRYLLIPVSTYETVMAMDPRYECCKSSGAMVAIDTVTGNILWNHRVEQKPKSIGKGLISRSKKYAPSGSAVWNSPGVDIEEGRVFFGTGQSLQSPASNFSDAIIALDLETGKRIWSTQTLAGDAYNVGCEVPVVRRMVCPKENGPDFDFGASVIQSLDFNGNKILLAGQKSGEVFRLNPENGEIVWKSRIGNGGLLGGVHFGMATDQSKLYVPISDRWVNRDYDEFARPGLYAVDLESGAILWSVMSDDICKDRKPLYGEGYCFPGFSAPISIANDLLFAGSLDGRFSVYSTKDGTKLWEFDTLRTFQTVNKQPAVGGSIDAAGPVISDNWIFINSGYAQHAQMAGNVILAFSIE